MNDHKKDILDDIERLAVVANRDVPPATNVTASVMRRIRQDKSVIHEKPLVIFAMGSLAVAIAVLIVSLPSLAELTDPLNTFIQSSSLAML